MKNFNFRKVATIGLTTIMAVWAMGISAFADNIKEGNIDNLYPAIQNDESTISTENQAYATYTYIVNASSGANMRKTPGLSGTIIATLPKGTIVTYNTKYNIITPEDGYNWRYVLYNGTYGYVADEYLDLYTLVR